MSSRHRGQAVFGAGASERAGARDRDEFADRNIVELREGLPGDLLDGPCRHDGPVLTDEIVSDRRQGVRHPADGSMLLSHRHPPGVWLDVTSRGS